ncbi:unnamed protein product [Rhizoctonia solani]|uniref:Peptide hydrolase n=1 Tax=Rhizoctonia solani TaxID=456999 RepID=A0A8H3CCD3_9AGAM|nr:unnamed protein product [Rhizoctonia solani]
MDFEVFEVQPPTANVMSKPGKLVRPYPWPAVRIPNDIASNSDFTGEVANFLVQMDADMLDESAASTKRAGSTIDEVRDSAHPHFIANLFIGILRGLGESIEPNRVIKRVADEVCWKSAFKPWRRSPLWLVIRVVMQTSLVPKSYKNFMIYFLCQILRSCLKVPEFSGELLYARRIKIARRIDKVQASIPAVLAPIVENYFQTAQNTLQEQWNQIQSDQAHRLDWKPESLDIKGATEPSIPTLYPYLQSVCDRVVTSPRPHKPNFGPSNPLDERVSLYPDVIPQSQLISIAGGKGGITVSQFNHSWPQKSIIAKFNGASTDAGAVIFGCHIDSINLLDPSKGRAPGADDNGTGTVNLIEVFRALIAASFSPARPIEFHFYVGEEGGLLGSQDVSTKYQTDGKAVYAMINLDMTGYVAPGTNEAIALVNDNVDPGLTAYLRSLISIYCSIPAAETKCGYACSDHASWSSKGYPAAFPFEEFAKLVTAAAVELGTVD